MLKVPYCSEYKEIKHSHCTQSLQTHENIMGNNSGKLD